MTQTKKPLSNNGTIHPDPYGASPNNPRGSTLDPVTGSTMGMQSVKDRPNWNTKNGGYKSG